jgi:hypothetical protein
MKLATSCRKVARRATVAWRKRIIFRKSSTHGNCGPLKEVTATGMKITRCAGHRRRRQNEDNIELETPKRTDKNRRWKYSERNNDIRDKGLKQRLRGNKQIKDRTTNGIEGWSQGNEHLRELEEHAKRTYMRSTVRKTRNECPRLPAGHGESQIGPCGGDDPLQNGKKKETAHMGGTGSRSTGPPTESE